MFGRKARGKQTEKIRSRENDSVTTSGDGHPEYSGKSVTRRAEDYARQQQEPGRVGDKSTARFVTGIGADDERPVDKKSPGLV